MPPACTKSQLPHPAGATSTLQTGKPRSPRSSITPGSCCRLQAGSLSQSHMPGAASPWLHPALMVPLRANPCSVERWPTPNGSPIPWQTPQFISIRPGAEQSLRMRHQIATASITLPALTGLPPPLRGAPVQTTHHPQGRPRHRRLQMLGLRLRSQSCWLCDCGLFTKPLCAWVPSSEAHLTLPCALTLIAHPSQHLSRPHTCVPATAGSSLGGNHHLPAPPAAGFLPQLPDSLSKCHPSQIHRKPFQKLL